MTMSDLALSSVFVEKYSAASDHPLRTVSFVRKSESELTAKVQQLRQDLALEAVLLTRSEEGMSLYTAQQVTHTPTVAREVYDVSGAGDTVIATLAAMLAAGVPLPQAVVLANRAGGIVVGKLGASTVSLEELSI